MDRSTQVLILQRMTALSKDAKSRNRAGAPGVSSLSGWLRASLVRVEPCLAPVEAEARGVEVGVLKDTKGRFWRLLPWVILYLGNSMLCVVMVL